MSKLQLFVKGLKITEWDIFPPPFKKLDFADRCDARQRFIKMKSEELFQQHLRAILKHPDYEIIYVVESKGNEQFLGREEHEIVIKKYERHRITAA